jgi:hypothetical protein
MISEEAESHTETRTFSNWSREFPYKVVHVTDPLKVRISVWLSARSENRPKPG